MPTRPPTEPTRATRPRSRRNCKSSGSRSTTSRWPAGACTRAGPWRSDLQAFCQKYNRPVPSVTPVSVGFPLLTLDQIAHLPPDERKEMLGASGEVMMDVQIIRSEERRVGKECRYRSAGGALKKLKSACLSES